MLSSTTSFTEDASSNQAGSLVASFTASDPEGASLTIALSDTTNYALSTNSNRVLLTSEGLSKSTKVHLCRPSSSGIRRIATSSAVTVSPSVTAVDDPAIITGDTSGSGGRHYDHGHSTATDEEGLTDNTYFSIVSNHAPAKGTASINAKSGAWTYAPNTNYFGSDSFTVTVTDDQGGTTTKAVSLTITNVDDPAVISGDTSGSGAEDTTITGTLSATDVEGLTDNTYFSIESDDSPANGIASINAQSGAWIYTPKKNYFGSDSFTVTVTDDLNGTTKQSVSLTITPVNNDAPLGNDGSISLREDTVYSFELSDFPLNDPDEPVDSLTNIKLVDMPDRGQLMLNDQPIESVYTINFENSSLSDWQTLGDVAITSTDSQSHGAGIGFDESVAESSYVLLSTSSGQSVTQIEDFLGLSRGLLNSFSSDQDTSDQFLDASGLKRDISVEAGQQLEFDWKFLAGDELPFNDTLYRCWVRHFLCCKCIFCWRLRRGSRHVYVCLY